MAGEFNNDFWAKHGPNMVEYLILAGIIAIFVAGWNFKKDFADLRGDTNGVIKQQTYTMLKAEKNGSDISEIKASNITRAELHMTVSRIERSLERIEDKIEKRVK